MMGIYLRDGYLMINDMEYVNLLMLIFVNR